MSIAFYWRVSVANLILLQNLFIIKILKQTKT